MDWAPHRADLEVLPKLLGWLRLKLELGQGTVHCDVYQLVPGQHSHGQGGAWGAI